MCNKSLPPPDASLLRARLNARGHLHSDKYFSLNTKSVTSQHHEEGGGLRGGFISDGATWPSPATWGYVQAGCRLTVQPASQPASQPSQLRRNDHLLPRIPMVLPLPWILHVHTPRNKSTSFCSLSQYCIYSVRCAHQFVATNKAKLELKPVFFVFCFF